MMASPQLENGHIRVANDLYENILLYPFTKRELLIVLSIIRLTYGYRKKTDAMTHYQIGKLCGQRRGKVATTVGELASRNILIVTPSGRIIRGQEISTIGVNKDFDEWLTGPKSGPIDRAQNGSSDRNTTGPKTGPVTGPNLAVTGPKTGPVTGPKTGHSINSKDNTKDRKTVLVPTSTENNTRGTRLKLDQLPQDWHTAALAILPRCNPYALFEEFRDYWIAVPGQRGCKLDWLATWRNNIRRKAGQVPTGNGSEKKSAASRFMENLKNA